MKYRRKLRRHIEGTGAGTDTDWLNVEKNKNMKIGPVVNNDLPKEPAAGASHVSSSTDSAGPFCPALSVPDRLRVSSLLPLRV
jgi:hypothetical protein